MPTQKEMICMRMNQIVRELNDNTNCMYWVQSHYSRYVLLNQIKSKIEELHFINNLICIENEQMLRDRLQELPNQREFTLAELAEYDGKNSRPAYVSVEQIVYDVTNNATWAAATHFGLSAGKDLTNEFNACHEGQAILNKLKVVGKLV